MGCQRLYRIRKLEDWWLMSIFMLDWHIHAGRQVHRWVSTTILGKACRCSVLWKAETNVCFKSHAICVRSGQHHHIYPFDTMWYLMFKSIQFQNYMSRLLTSALLNSYQTVRDNRPINDYSLISGLGQCFEKHANYDQPTSQTKPWPCLSFTEHVQII